MKVFPASVIRKFDSRAMKEAHIPGTVLMENAAKAIAEETLLFAESSPIRDPEILILAGKGNNGGDALGTARFLFENGWKKIKLRLTHRKEELSPDSQIMFERLPEALASGIKYDLSEEDFHTDTIVLDGLLGTGVSGAPKGISAVWIDRINASKAPVLAIDVPSGLDAENGTCEKAVTADLTITMAAPKTGFFTEDGIRKTGRLAVAEIGIPRNFFSDTKEAFHAFGLSDARELLKREAFDSFKNRRGHLCVAGGSGLYTGAPCLAAEAALRTGAGLVTLLLPHDAELFCRIPKALILRRHDKNELPDFGVYSAVAAGPGMSRSAEKLPLLEKILSLPMPVVLDADALNLLSEHPELLEKKSASPWIITPHPGEAQRLLEAFGLPAGSRLENALALAQKLHAVTVYKGARSIAASPDGKFSCNLSGSPALATAGSGDVLAGICGAFLAMGYMPFEAAQLAVFVHGSAGEILSPCGSHLLIADDLPDAIPSVLKKILPVF